MKGGWAGAKVASASEEPGDARRTPVTSRRYGGERPHPRGGGRGSGVVSYTIWCSFLYDTYPDVS